MKEFYMKKFYSINNCSLVSSYQNLYAIFLSFYFIKSLFSKQHAEDDYKESITHREYSQSHSVHENVESCHLLLFFTYFLHLPCFLPDFSRDKLCSVEKDWILKKSKGYKANTNHNPHCQRGQLGGLGDGAGDRVVEVDHHEEEGEEETKSARDCIRVNSEADPAGDDHEHAGTKESVQVDLVLALHVEVESYKILKTLSSCYLTKYFQDKSIINTIFCQTIKYHSIPSHQVILVLYYSKEPDTKKLLAL